MAYMMDWAFKTSYLHLPLLIVKLLELFLLLIIRLLSNTALSYFFEKVTV